jgi:hypothetical protein
MKIAFALSFAALTLVACGSGSTELEPELDEEAPAVTESALSTEACPYMYRCGMSGSWFSTYSTCDASCAINCYRLEFNNGHCILH